MGLSCSVWAVTLSPPPPPTTHQAAAHGGGGRSRPLGHRRLGTKQTQNVSPLCLSPHLHEGVLWEVRKPVEVSGPDALSSPKLLPLPRQCGVSDIDGFLPAAGL